MDALAVAKKNIKAAPNCLLIQADWLKAIRPSSVDVIVSNPPYIAPGDPHLADLSFEPERALVAEQNGYAAYALFCAKHLPCYAQVVHWFLSTL